MVILRPKKPLFKILVKMEYIYEGASRKKFLRNMELRDKLMADLEEGHTALLSFQQAIGGSLSRSERVCEDHDQDEEPLLFTNLQKW